MLIPNSWFIPPSQSDLHWLTLQINIAKHIFTVRGILLVETVIQVDSVFSMSLTKDGWMDGW